MDNIMLDLETLGTRPDAAIISIGAVYFNEKELGKTFYQNIDERSCFIEGLTCDKSTLEFWARQSDEAKEVLTDDQINIKVALEKLYAWVNTNKNNVKVWGNGASFDNVIIRSAYKACDLTPPWRWWNDRCFRTFKNLYKEIEVREDMSMIKHYALDDAKIQAMHIIKVCEQKALKLN